MEYQKLPVEFKTKWIEALRSGKYSQTVGELYSSTANTRNVEQHDGTNKEVLYEPDGFCCLGVACAISGISKEEMDGIGNPETLVERYYGVESGIHDRFEAIPLMLRQSTCEVDQLIHFNDEEMWTFKKIADWIEENL